MRSFIAQIIYSIQCDRATTNEYEQQWRLVYADNEAEALEEARNIAALEEVMITDRHGRIIEWKTVAVKDIQQVELGHGTLLFSSTEEATPVVSPVWAEEMQA